MGFDPSAETYVGVRLLVEDLYEEQKERGCDHWVSDRFCEKCGKPKWVGEDVPIEARRVVTFKASGLLKEKINRKQKKKGRR